MVHGTAFNSLIHTSQSLLGKMLISISHQQLFFYLYHTLLQLELIFFPTFHTLHLELLSLLIFSWESASQSVAKYKTIIY